MIPVGGAHEIAIVLPLGAVLGGRVIGPWLAVRRQPQTGRPVPATQGPAVSPVGTGRAGNGGLRARRRRAGRPGWPGLAHAAAQPSVGSGDEALADWLEAHHLTSGLSGDRQVNITTLATGGKVHMAPLITQAKYGYLWESRGSLVRPRRLPRELHRHDRAAGGRERHLPARGPLAVPQAREIYQFQQYSILVYDRNVLKSVVQPIPSLLYGPPGLFTEGRTTGEAPRPSLARATATSKARLEIRR